MITAPDYWKGRDVTYATDLTTLIAVNAAHTIERVNQLLTSFHEANPIAHVRGCNSGWRPPAVNAATRNAAKLSRHMTGEAIDVSDDDEQLDRWLMTADGLQALEDFGLYMEMPSATPRWSHMQTVPPRSGNRRFFP